MAKLKKESSTEETVLHAARKVFIKHGMSGARMQDIADEAGINKALLHYYFRTKEKLFERVFEEATHQFIPRVNDIFESDAPLFDKIQTFCDEYISKIIENPFIPLFIINEINKQPDEFITRMWGKRKPNVAKLALQINEAARKGIIKKTDPLHLIMNMMSLCIFPFLAKPMIQKLAGVNDRLFNQLMDQRKTEVAKFIIDSIRK